MPGDCRTTLGNTEINWISSRIMEGENRPAEEECEEPQQVQLPGAGPGITGVRTALTVNELGPEKPCKHPTPTSRQSDRLNDKPSPCRHPPRRILKTGNGRSRLQRRSRGSDTPVGKKSRRWYPHSTVPMSVVTHVICHEHEHEEEGYEDDHSVEQGPGHLGSLTDSRQPTRLL